MEHFEPSVILFSSSGFGDDLRAYRQFIDSIDFSYLQQFSYLYDIFAVFPYSDDRYSEYEHEFRSSFELLPLSQQIQASEREELVSMDTTENDVPDDDYFISDDQEIEPEVQQEVSLEPEEVCNDVASAISALPPPGLSSSTQALQISTFPPLVVSEFPLPLSPVVAESSHGFVSTTASFTSHGPLVSANATRSFSNVRFSSEKYDSSSSHLVQRYERRTESSSVCLTGNELPRLKPPESGVYLEPGTSRKRRSLSQHFELEDSSVSEHCLD